MLPEVPADFLKKEVELQSNTTRCIRLRFVAVAHHSLDELLLSFGAGISTNGLISAWWPAIYFGHKPLQAYMPLT